MLARVMSAAVSGIDGFLVQVEVDLANGFPTFSTVGLPDAAVRESKDRVVAAVRNSGFDFPVRKVTVNLSPADVRKEGTAFDLPIAVGVLAADERIPLERLARRALVGELALDGRLRPVRGILPIALAARREAVEALIVPVANAEEALLVEGLNVVPAATLEQTVLYLRGEWNPDPRPAAVSPAAGTAGGPDFSDVRGQLFAKRALEVAAAGGHNVLLIGPPGSGKTMLARRFPGLLPPMFFDEALETRKIHSVAGVPLGALGERPFRSPHHTISDVALIGGGSIPRPGEVSLAHNGALFLDEFPEFDRRVLEVLRQPLEEGRVTVSRAAQSAVFPARFTLLAAMNPCPCGYAGHPERPCGCTPLQVQKYRGRISGPLLDRIDLHIEVPALKLAELTEEAPPGESSETVRARVLAACARQESRLEGTGARRNAHMGVKQVRAHCRLGPSAKALLKAAVARFGLSARSFDRILKVGRTVADLASSPDIRDEHIAEAVGYRSLDRPVLQTV